MAPKPYHPIFIDANGYGPWPCYGCGEPVTLLLVHHLDEDHFNDAPENLVAMHQSCHIRLHRVGERNRGRKASVETKAKMSAVRRGKPKTEEHKRKIRESNLGLKRSAETRQRISDSKRGRIPRRRMIQCGGCSLVTNTGALANHQRASGHAGQIEVKT